ATVTATIENTSATALVTATPAGARRRRAAAIVAGLVLVGAAGVLVWVKPWARNDTPLPARPARLAAESARVIQAPGPPLPRAPRPAPPDRRRDRRLRARTRGAGHQRREARRPGAQRSVSAEPASLLQGGS